MSEVRYEHITGNRWRAVMPDGASVEVSSTYERAYPGLPAPDGSERFEHHADLYHWAIAQLAETARWRVPGPPSHIADVACGSGYGTHMLRQAGWRATTGYDLDAEAVAYATARYGGRFELAGRTGYIGPDEFSAIVSIETIEHIAEAALAIEKWRNKLVTGGLLVLSTPLWDGKQPLLSEHHVREYTSRALADLVKAGGLHPVAHPHRIGVRGLHQGIVAVKP